MPDRNQAPKIHTIGHLSLPPCESRILTNGITLHLYDGGSQQVNQLTLIRPGGRLEAPRPVVARLAASLPHEGAAGVDGAAISETLDFHGAMLRTVTDAHYTMMTLTSLNSMTAEVLPTMRNIITAPDFPEAAFENCREIERQEYLVSMSKVMNVASRQLAPLIKGAEHPESHPDTLQDIDDVTLDTVRDYHSRVVSGGGAHAFVSGRLTPAVRAEITDMLESLPAPSQPMPLATVAYSPQAPGRVDGHLDGAVQAAVQVAIPAPERAHPDYVPLRFAVMALGGYFGSRLMKNIREDKGYTYGISAYLIGGLDGSYINIAAQTDAAYVDLLLDEVGTEMTRLATAPPEGDEMARLRQYITSTLLETLDSPFAIMDYYKTIQCVAIPEGYFDRQVQLVRELTPDIIARAAAAYLDPTQMRVSVVS